ncbi:hypothetical protein [Sanguibacter gelidistatuariae]|nr:hypothetical protein [Sanguibacter gelidistatuariae]
MATVRGGIGDAVWGASPREYTGLGAKTFTVYTNGPVYYAPGGGAQTDDVENMSAKWLNVSRIASAEQPSLLMAAIS